MKVLTNQRGTILVATYLVLAVIIIVATSFFGLVATNNKAISKGNDGAKALNFAEKGLAYAYFESYNLGWDWHTHKWNHPEKKLQKLNPQERLKLRTDCTFDNATGFYVHNSGEFMIKAYPDLTRENDTIVVSLGISGNEKRAVMYYLTRRGIYDFFVFTPYNLDLYDAVGHVPKMNGGGIHSNGDIYLDDYIRLEDISELSAGESGSIYYTSDQYPAPYYADKLLGNKSDGRAPITRLDNLKNVWRNDKTLSSGPFGYYNWKNQWNWRSSADQFVGDSTSEYPTEAFSSTEAHFRGSNQARYNVANGTYDPFTVEYNDDDEIIAGAKNDSGGPLNSYNVWIKPYEVDENGDKIEHEWAQIPSELPEEWQWEKYYGDDYGDDDAVGEVPVSFETKVGGAWVDVDDTYWDIVGGNVEILNAPIGGTQAQWDTFYAANPNAKSYWDMYKYDKFWETVRGDSFYGTYLNPEVLGNSATAPGGATDPDGLYGDERSTGGMIPVEHTNSMKQATAWKNEIASSGLDGFVRDGNTGGEYLTPPDFSKSYSRLAEKDGILIDLVDSFDGEFSDRNEWYNVLRDSVNAARDEFNKNGAAGVAETVEFINTFTGRWNVVLELDLEKMQQFGRYPANGIIYSKVPIRLTKATKLPRAQDGYGFTVLGEENIYLQGDYNTNDWVISAVISKKRVFTLSDNFNDPTEAPAPVHYPDYPYLYIKDDGTGNYVEAIPNSGGGKWIYIGYLDSDGIEDKIDYFAEIDDMNESVLRDNAYAKDDSYQDVFSKWFPSGDQKKTWEWITGESYTSGYMPNWVGQDHTYNCLIAANRWLDSSQSNKGDILENWGSKNRIFMGAYFVLEDEGFTADDSEYVDYEKFGYSNRGRSWGSIYGNSSFLWNYNARESMEYDERFQTATRSPSDVFFGGAESLWAEVTEEVFYNTKYK